MTSQINPADIDGNYPIAGVSNNTQGMRDNFTNTRTNFQYAADEITDLQNKVVLKAALSGTTLDNNLGNNVVYNALVKGISGTVVAIANTSGTITIDCSAGPYQSINMAGNIALSFTSNTWPTAGTLGMVRTQITVDQAGRTLTLPNTVSNGIVGLQGYASNVITFANTGTYEFGFSTTNAGNAITIFDLNRPLSYYTNNVTIAANTVSTSPTTGALTVAGGVGVVGNIHGFVRPTAGTATAPALSFVTGTNLTAATAGAVEYDGVVFYGTPDTSSGRAFTENTSIFRLTADGSALGPSISDYFGATSSITLAAGGVYEINYEVFFLKTIAGTVTFTLTASQAPVNVNAYYVGSGLAGIASSVDARSAATVKSTSTTTVLPVTGTLTTAVNHYYSISAIVQAHATVAGTFKLQITSSAGTVTPLIGSYYKVTKLPNSNTGAFS